MTVEQSFQMISAKKQCRYLIDILSYSLPVLKSFIDNEYNQIVVHGAGPNQIGSLQGRMNKVISTLEDIAELKKIVRV